MKVLTNGLYDLTDSDTLWREELMVKRLNKLRQGTLAKNKNNEDV